MRQVNSIASVSVLVTELNSLKTRINELQARVEAKDQYISMNQIHFQSLIQDQPSPSPVQSET